jgi:hypothetical protein
LYGTTKARTKRKRKKIKETMKKGRKKQEWMRKDERGGAMEEKI